MLARQDELFLEPAAAVLLRGLTITPTWARYDDFDLALDDEIEVNRVLLQKLASVFGAVIEKPGLERIAAQLAKVAAHAEIPGRRRRVRASLGARPLATVGLPGAVGAARRPGSSPGFSYPERTRLS